MAMDDNSFGYDAHSEAPETTDAPGTGVGVIKIAKRDYAIGLHWNAVDTPSKAVSEARELAGNASFNADFFCVRPGGTPQFGLGWRGQGHKAGMPSLAAHAASAKSGSWIGLFKVPGGYYLIAVRDDGILSECDRFFADADEARNTFEDFQAQSEWPEAIAPIEFSIPGTVVGLLENLLDGRPGVRLREVRRSSNIIRLAVAALAIGGLVVGGMFYMDMREAARLQEWAAEQAATAKNVIVPEEEPEPIPPMPWEGKLMGTRELEECYKEVLKFPLDVPGWEVKEFFCVNGNVAAALDRSGPAGSGGGSINWIKLQVHREGFTPSIISPAEGSGSRVSVQWALKGIPNIPVDLKTAPLGKMKAAMLAVLEERMTPVTFSDADSNQYWRGFTFSFTTKENPLGFNDILSAMPGVIMNRVSYNVRSAAWTLEGKAYEQLPLPQKPSK